jgi:hypothetical protein
MRVQRILSTLAGLATGLLAIALVVAFLPAFQTWAARKVLARIPGSSVERVSIGVGRASAVGLRVEMDGAVLTIPAADADVGVLWAALGGVCHVRSLQAKGWTLDFARSRAAAESLEAAPSHHWTERAIGGVVAAFKVPSGFSLDGVNLEGDIIFPDGGGRPAGRAHVIITGGGLAASRDGRFLCTATASVDDPAAPVSSVAVSASLKVSMAPAGTLTRADLRADATAVGRNFPTGIGLSCTAAATQEAGRQSLSVSLLRGQEHLAEISGENEGSSALVSGSWRVDLRDTDLAPFALGHVLPAFYAAGRGEYGFDASSGDIHATGKLQATADRLGVVSARLAPLGKVDLVADFDMALAGDSLRVSRLDTSVVGASPVATMRALQSFEFKPSTGELKVAMPSGDLVGVSVKAMPLGWLKGVLPFVDLAGNPAAGEFVMRAEDGRLVLRTRAPLQANGVSVARSGVTLAAGLECSAFILGDYAPQGWQMQLAPFEVRSDGTKIVSLEARFGRLAGAETAIKAAGSWSASLPALLAMPLASGFPRLTAGDASGNFEASLDSTRSIRLTMALANLAVPSGVVLPTMTTEMRADFGADGTTKFSLPLRLDYGSRAPEMVVTGLVRRDPDGPYVEAALTGTKLTSSDLAVVAALSSAPPSAGPAGVSPSAMGAPVRACWPSVHGRFTLQIDELLLPRFALHDVRGTLRAAPDALGIEGGSAVVGEGSAAHFDGVLTFSAGDARPYSFTAKVAVDKLDATSLFTGGDPGKPPEIEGQFALTANLSGKAESPDELPRLMEGDAKLSSHDGVLRILHAEVLDSIKQDSSKIASALDTVTSLFGKKGEKLGTSLVETAKALDEIHYDQMTIAAERGDDLDIRFTQIAVLAPEERLAGTGRISHVDGLALRDQPLSLDLTLGVRGRITRFMDVVGLLGDSQDDLGYTGLYQPIHLGGTLRNIDQSQWKDMLTQAPLRKGGGLFDKLLGR